MHYPRGIDIAAFFVQIVENTAADEKPRHGKDVKYWAEPARSHADVIKGKKPRAENVRKPPRHLVFKSQKRKAAEEKLL